MLNFHRKQLSSPKKDVPLYKKRNLDFTDYAHREAVNRLKFLLAESYTPCSNRPRRGSFCHKHDDSDDTDNVSVRFLLCMGEKVYIWREILYLRRSLSDRC